MKHLKRFNEIFGFYYNPQLTQKIEQKRQEVRRAYTEHGVGSKEYETLFDELHDLNQELEQKKSDHYNGRMPKPRA